MKLSKKTSRRPAQGSQKVKFLNMRRSQIYLWVFSSTGNLITFPRWRRRYRENVIKFPVLENTQRDTQRDTMRLKNAYSLPTAKIKNWNQNLHARKTLFQLKI